MSSRGSNNNKRTSGRGKNSGSGENGNSGSARNGIIDFRSISFDQASKELGKGGFGVVRKGAFDGHSVAVKSLFIDHDSVDPLVAAELFLSEAKKMRELSHPRIVKFIGFVMETFSIVMEFMAGGTLDDYIEEHQHMPWTDRTRLAFDIAEGMAYLHAKTTPDGKTKKDLFHQDLKSANVLLCTEEVIREKATNESTRRQNMQSYAVSYVNHIGGTRTYMAPELHQTSRFTKECDVYAYGVILLELATLLRPTEAIADFRSRIEGYDMPKMYRNLNLACLSLEPLKRPGFDIICNFFSENEKTLSKHQPIEAGVVRTKTIGGIKRFSTKKSKNIEKSAYGDDMDSYDDISVKLSENTQFKEGQKKSPAKPHLAIVCSKKRLLIFIGILCVVLIGLAVGLGIALSGNNSSNVSSIQPIVSGTTASGSGSTSRTTTTAATPTPSSVPEMLSWSNYISWAGVTSEYAYALSESEQDSALSTLKNANIRVIRIVMSHVQANSTQGIPESVSDVEPSSVGVYNDAILNKMDLWMKKCVDAGMKLVIALHDRRSLGCTRTDQYVTQFNLTSATPCANTYATTDSVKQFYTNTSIINAFDNRLKYILGHRNIHLGNVTWANLSNVILSFDIQERAFIGDNMDWMCERAKTIKTLLKSVNSPISVSTGGIGDGKFNNATLSSMLACESFDWIGLNATAYDNTTMRTLLNNSMALINSTSSTKKLVIQEFCPRTGLRRYDDINLVAGNANALRIPWIIASFNRNGTSRCDFYSDDKGSMLVLTNRGLDALKGTNQYYTPTRFLEEKSLCKANSECVNNCCSDQNTNNGNTVCDRTADNC